MASKIVSSISDVVEGALQSVGVEKLSDRVIEFTDKNIRNPNLIKNIEESLAAKYGGYPFYNDLCAYIYSNNIIKRVIDELLKINSSGGITKNKFIEDCLQDFSVKYKGYSAYDHSYIKSAFELIFEVAFNEILCLKPHTDIGKLQAAENMWFAQISEENITNTEILKSIHTMVSGLANPISMANAVEIDFGHNSEKVEAFLKKIEDVGNKDNATLDSEKTLIRYQELAGKALITLRGENEKQIDRVICSLNCHMAICYANLGNVQEAFECLEQIPPMATEESKLYQFVNAVLIINYSVEEKYFEAEKCLNRALELDKNYYRAYILNKYLKALKRDDSLEEIIKTLDEYIQKIPVKNRKNDIIADYYLYRGFINKELNQYDLAEKDFISAKEHGYDEVIIDLNLALLFYNNATQKFPRDVRVFCINVDVPLIRKSMELLRKWLIERNDSQIPIHFKSRMVGVYVSSCALLGIKHNLTPVDEYLKLPDLEYEVQRMLIMGIDGVIDEETLNILDKDDALYVRIANKLRVNQYIDVKKMLLLMSDEERQALPITTLYLVLQASIANHDVDTYYDFRKYIVEFDELGLVECIDAFERELNEDIETAKLILDKYAISSKDYHILRNIVCFYARNGYDIECEQLLIRILELLKNSIIYVDDKPEFYTTSITFLVNHKSIYAGKFVDAIDIEDEAMWKLKAYFYDNIKDISRLCDMLTKLYLSTGEYSVGYNEIICLVKLMKYECALEKALELLITIHENNIKDKIQVIWIISNIYLFLGRNKESFEWAKKAHELTIDMPGDNSHNAYLGRATRVGHLEDALESVLEYKQKHPVVISEWMKEVKVSEDNLGEEVIQAIKNATGISHEDYAQKEENVGNMYRRGVLSNATILKHYGKDISQLFSFAKKNKLRISSGKWASVEEKEAIIDKHILVDSVTLIIMDRYDCLEALKEIENIHICHKTIAVLQDIYVSLNYYSVEKILHWIGQAGNIIIDYDGYLDESSMTNIFSNEIMVCCNTASRLKIPFLTSEILLEDIIAYEGTQDIKEVQIVNIVALCYKTMKRTPDKLSHMIYNLLEECTFVNFTAETILEQIKKKNYIISDCDLDRFFICNTSCDMKSFANVYMGVLRALKNQYYDASISFCRIVLENTKKIWRRGTYYRSMSRDYDIESATIKARMINIYVIYILKCIQTIYGTIPCEIEEMVKEVKVQCINYIGEKVYSKAIDEL